MVDTLVEKVKKCPLNRVVKYLHTIGTVTVIQSREVAAKQGFTILNGDTVGTKVSAHHRQGGRESGVVGWLLRGVLQ